MNENVSSLYSGLARALEGELTRSRDNLVPEAYSVLWEVVRFIVLYGGRGAAKSWSIARVLLVLASETPLRILCCREIQGSIRESAYRLLVDQINLLQLDDDYDIQADAIVGKSGSRFYFEGLRYNGAKIRSYEGVDVVWVEEAQSVSDFSWETLLPTIRKTGSRFFISFNPMTVDDPVTKRFVDTPRPSCIAKKVSYRDNPHLSEEAEAERLWLERTDPDAYLHVWEGFPRTVSDALILRGKFFVEEFQVNAAWAGPYHGLDYGFSRDPSAAVRCYIDDETRTLYVDREFWALGMDIDALPDALESAIPQISHHVVYADSSRPESTSYLARNGIPSARSGEKWPGSVDDGIAYLRSFARIVIDPSCKHLLDECKAYSYKTDRLTGTPLPDPEDKNNHLIDALRYALSPLIRNQPAGGYLNRAALLIVGEAVEPDGSLATKPGAIHVSLAMCERPGSGVGVVYWATGLSRGRPMLILDYDLVEIDDALNISWLQGIYEHAEALREEWKSADTMVSIWIEEGELDNNLATLPVDQLIDVSALYRGERPGRNWMTTRSDELAVGLDARMSELRAIVNGGQFVKLGRGAYINQTTFRSVTANHLLGQLLGYRPGQPDPATELVNAFALSCLMVRET